MNRLRYIISIFFMTISIMTSLLNAESAEARLNLNINGTSPVICDEAELFSEYEEVSIIDMATDLYKQTGYVYIVITTNEIKDYISGHELEGIYNDHRNELAGNGTVLFLINTENKTMPCELQSYKSAAEIFSHEMCSYINNEAMLSVNNGSYFEAVSGVFNNLKAAAEGTLSEEQLIDDNKDYQKNESKLFTAIPYLAIAFCVAYIIAALILYLIYTRSKSSYKKMYIKKDEAGTSDNIKKYRMYVRSVESTFSSK